MAGKVNASHILLKTETEALACLTYMKQGKSFEELAREKSLCPSGKKGGSLGWFSRLQKCSLYTLPVLTHRKQSIFDSVQEPKHHLHVSTGFLTGQMVREFENACFSGKKSEVAGPIKTQFVYHLIRINELA